MDVLDVLDVFTLFYKCVKHLRRGSKAARLLGLWVRIPPGAWMSVLSVVCCQVEVSCDGLIPRPEESYRL